MDERKDEEMKSQMTMDEMMFWNGWPQLIHLYETLRTRLADAYPDMRIKVSKTQISFYNKHMFAMASPPVRRKKEWPKEFMMVSFGLPDQVCSPRIAVSVEAYRNHWTHHVIVETEQDIDEMLLGWIAKAYEFSAAKR